MAVCLAGGPARRRGSVGLCHDCNKDLGSSSSSSDCTELEAVAAVEAAEADDKLAQSQRQPSPRLLSRRESVPQVLRPLPPDGRKLVLHFDARNTIFVADLFSRITVEMALNTYISGVVWGEEQLDGGWHCLSDTPSLYPPRPGVTSLYKLFERAIVRVPEDRQRLRETLGNFTEQPHGKRFRRLFQEKLHRLRWPHEVANDKLTVTGQDGSAYHYLLPSFLNLVQALEASGRQFCIVIRTFGRDAPHILNALDLLAKGQHPGYPRQLDMKVNLAPERFQRLGADQFRYMRSDGVELTQERQVYNHWSASSGAMAVVDDFAFWQENNYSSSASKLLWFDPNDTGIQHIIFDDNIRVFDDDSIVHFRSFETASADAGSDCSPERLQSLEDVLFVTADLLESSSNANYFIDKVLQCQENYSRLCREMAKDKNGLN